MSIFRASGITQTPPRPADGYWRDGVNLGIPRDVYFDENGDLAPIPDGTYVDGERIEEESE
jgi:hypothetical protein